MWRSFLGVFFSLFVLSIQVGVTLSTHYCGGSAVETVLSLSKEDLHCLSKETTPSCADGHEAFFHTSGCCRNEYTQLVAQDNYLPVLALDHSFAPALPLCDTFSTSLFRAYTVLASKPFTYTDNPSPPHERHLVLFTQAFLL